MSQFGVSCKYVKCLPLRVSITQEMDVNGLVSVLDFWMFQGADGLVSWILCKSEDLRPIGGELDVARGQHVQMIALVQKKIKKMRGNDNFLDKWGCCAKNREIDLGFDLSVWKNGKQAETISWALEEEMSARWKGASNIWDYISGNIIQNVLNGISCGASDKAVKLIRD